MGLQKVKCSDCSKGITTTFVVCLRTMILYRDFALSNNMKNIKKGLTFKTFRLVLNFKNRFRVIREAAMLKSGVTKFITKELSNTTNEVFGCFSHSNLLVHTMAQYYGRLRFFKELKQRNQAERSRCRQKRKNKRCAKLCQFSLCEA